MKKDEGTAAPLLDAILFWNKIVISLILVGNVLMSPT